MRPLARSFAFLLAAILFAIGPGGALPAHAEEEAEAERPAEPKLKGAAKKKHDKEVKQYLATLLDRKSQALVEEKIRSVGAAKTRAARDALIKFTIGRKSKRYVRLAFLEIGKIGGQGGVEFLCGKNALKSKDVLVAEGAAIGLAESADPRAVEPLLEVITKRGTKIVVLGACGKALGKCADGDKKALAVVLEKSRDKKSSIRQPIAEALGFFRTDDALERLKEMLRKDSNAEVRASAARGLGHSGDPGAIEILQEALQDERSTTVKSAAMTAITKLRGG